MKGVLLKIVDVAFAFCVGGILVILMVVRAQIGRKRKDRGRNLLVLDMAYTLEMIRKRKLHESITCRDLNGFFDHVWSVHPCSTLIPPEDGHPLYGGVEETELSERHTIAEGKIGRYACLKDLPLLNFSLAQWSVYKYLMRLARIKNICVIRSGDPYYLGLWTLAIGRAMGIPCAVRVNINYDAFYTSTGNLAFPRLFRRRWIEKIVDRFTLKRMDLVAGANQDNLNFAIANGARPEVCTVFRYGNLIHSCHFRHPLQRPPADLYLDELNLRGKPFSITISRLEKLKHVGDVLKVIALLKERGTVLYGLIVGDGRMKVELGTMAEQSGIAEQIVFAGNRDQEWLASVIPRATVVISPFMGRALTEAALSAKPIVAYDIDWQSELIQTDRTGVLVPYKDWRKMADAVGRLLKDEPYATQLGNNARECVLKMMDPATLAAHERESYERLLKSN